MRRRRVLALLPLVLAGCSAEQLSPDQSPAGTPSGPSTSAPSATSERSHVFVDEFRLRISQQRVEAGVEPFATSYDTLISRADEALNAPMRSVADDGEDKFGPHRFEAVTNDRADYRSALHTGGIARNCALAHWFTGEDRYAERTIDTLHHWCLNDGTYMEPNNVIRNTSGAIAQNISIPRFIYAASFVRGHPHWETYDGSRPWDGGSSDGAEAAFQRWLSDWHDTFPDSEPDWCPTNNRWPWRIVNKAAVAAYLGDGTIMSTAKQMYRAQIKTSCLDGSTKERPWDDYIDVDANNGYFNAERIRENSFQYTGYNLLAHEMALLAFEAWDGTDLWNFNAPTDPHQGETLRKALNWYSPAVRDTSKWHWNKVQITDGDIEQAATVFELAYARWNQFEEVIENPGRIDGRPHWDRRILGPVTLTHGEY